MADVSRSYHKLSWCRDPQRCPHSFFHFILPHALLSTYLYLSPSHLFYYIAPFRCASYVLRFTSRPPTTLPLVRWQRAIVKDSSRSRSLARVSHGNEITPGDVETSFSRIPSAFRPAGEFLVADGQRNLVAIRGKCIRDS